MQATKTRTKVKAKKSSKAKAKKPAAKKAAAAPKARAKKPAAKKAAKPSAASKAAPKKEAAKKAAKPSAASKAAPKKEAVKKSAKPAPASKAAPKKEAAKKTAKPAAAPKADGEGRIETAAASAAEGATAPERKTELGFSSLGDVRILVVDDEPEVLNLLVPFLRNRGYAVSEAQDGDQALEKILTERPNIVVLDVMMPGLSGWEISRYVRERAELDPVRIIMATGIGKETNAATSPLYGADAYIDKPFRLDALEKIVSHVISRIEAGDFQSAAMS